MFINAIKLVSKPREHRLKFPVDILLKDPVYPAYRSLEAARTPTQYPFRIETFRETSKPTALKSRYEILNVASSLGSLIQIVERQSDKQLLIAQLSECLFQTNHAIYISNLVNHNNLLSVVDVVQERGQVIPIVEFCASNLLSYVQYRDLNIQSTFSQLVSGVCFLHSRGIAHRNLKLENIWLTSDRTVKITGLGCALVSDSSDEACQSNEVVGSIPYMAPEVLEGSNYNSFQADVWSLGIIFILLCTGRFPWSAAQWNNLTIARFNSTSSSSTSNSDYLSCQDFHYHNFLVHPKSTLMKLELNPSALHLALKMLHPHPQHRITSHELAQDLDLILNYD